jgi:membrane-associated protein
MSFLDPNALIASFGLVGIALIVFAESGLLIGFFLPGDSLLFAAGILAATGKLDIYYLVPVLTMSAILGDSFGYLFGRKTGTRIFRKPDAIIFKQEYIDKAETFYQKHGGKTVVLARFIPIMRTFAPIVAGVGKMDYRKFLAYNIIGGITWVSSISLLGYYFGSKIPGISHYAAPVVILVTIISFAQPIAHILKDPEARAKIIAKLRRK